VYHAPTVRAYRNFFPLAALLSVASTARAQSPDAEHAAAAPEGESTTPQSGYVSYPNERHLLFRATAGSGLRLNDTYGLGALLPAYASVDASFLFLNVGAFRMGPMLGVEAGFDSGGAGMQWAIMPGWMALWRVSSLLAFTGRVNVPILITRGQTGYFPIMYMSQQPVGAPLQHNLAASLGIAEIGVGAAVYLTSGFALTAEISGGAYLGDTGYPAAYFGFGGGVLVDCELLP
jgi:hypothetical protein